MLVLQISVGYVVLHYLYMLLFFGLKSLTAHKSDVKTFGPIGHIGQINFGVFGVFSAELSILAL